MSLSVSRAASDALAPKVKRALSKRAKSVWQVSVQRGSLSDRETSLRFRTSSQGRQDGEAHEDPSWRHDAQHDLQVGWMSTASLPVHGERVELVTEEASKQDEQAVRSLATCSERNEVVHVLYCAQQRSTL